MLRDIADWIFKKNHSNSKKLLQNNLPSAQNLSGWNYYPRQVMNRHQIIILLPVIGENVRGTTECGYLGAFTPAP